jgi:hypothetical protein
LLPVSARIYGLLHTPHTHCSARLLPGPQSPAHGTWCHSGLTFSASDDAIPVSLRTARSSSGGVGGA